VVLQLAPVMLLLILRAWVRAPRLGWRFSPPTLLIRPRSGRSSSEVRLHFLQLISQRLFQDIVRLEETLATPD
jgi:hypothetical protein